MLQEMILQARARYPLAAVALSLFLGACAVGPDFGKPEFPGPSRWPGSPGQTGGKFTELPSRPVSTPVDWSWWRSFGDPVLTSLEQRAVEGNLSIQANLIRLAQSRAQRDIAGADQFPLLRGNAAYTRAKPSEKGVFSLVGSLLGGSASASGPATAANGRGVGVIAIPGTGIKPFNLWQYGFDAAWELDLWGRVRRELESAEASVQAAAEAHRDALLSVMAEVAREYIDLRRIQRSRAITGEILAAAQESLELIRQRAANDLVSDLEIAQARAQVATIEAQLPALDQQESQAVNRLSLLLGRQPRELQAELAVSRPVPPVPPRVPIGLPSELARRRPDIRQAEARLHAATADIGVAVADFYPRISLSGSVALQALQFKDLGNWAARQYALGPSLTIPIFEGGRLKATLELREAQQQEAAIVYHDTVLKALHEVDDALTAYAEAQRRSDSLARAVQSAREASDLATRRYAVGISDYLPVLDARRSLLQAEQDHVNGTGTMAVDLVALYKALGGGWQAFQNADVVQ